MFGKKKKSRYSEGWADYPGVGRIYDADVAKFVKKHTHWWDRLDYHKMCDCAQLAFGMLADCIEKPKKKNWKF